MTCDIDNVHIHTHKHTHAYTQIISYGPFISYSRTDKLIGSNERTMNTSGGDLVQTLPGKEQKRTFCRNEIF